MEFAELENYRAGKSDDGMDRFNIPLTPDA
jgi:hypothetical protein